MNRLTNCGAVAAFLITLAANRPVSAEDFWTDPDLKAPLVTDIRKLTPSPTGHILYTRFERIKLNAPGVAPIPIPVGRIHIMTGDGKEPGPFICTSGLYGAQDPQWGPNGKSVVFASNWRHWESANVFDAFLADLRTGEVERITGCWRSAGNVIGLGTIRGTLLAGQIDKQGQAKPNVVGVEPARTVISYQGCQGRTFILGQIGQHHLLKNAMGQEMDVGAYEFAIPKVPAGKIWVKASSNSSVGDVVVIDVPANGQAEVTLNLTSGTTSIKTPLLTPDGKFIVVTQTNASTMLQQGGGGKAPLITAATSVKIWDVATGVWSAGWDSSRMALGTSKNPSLSPDGKWVVLDASVSFLENVAICSLDSLMANRPEPRVLVASQNSPTVRLGNVGPSWSPDGKQIAWVRSMTDPNSNILTNIFIINADGSGARQLTNFPAGKSPGRACWSPDGKRIAFEMSITRDGRPLNTLRGGNENLDQWTTDIWSIGVDGQDLTQLTNEGICGQPSWGK